MTSHSHLEDMPVPEPVIPSVRPSRNRFHSVDSTRAADQLGVSA